MPEGLCRVAVLGKTTPAAADVFGYVCGCVACNGARKRGDGFQTYDHTMCSAYHNDNQGKVVLGRLVNRNLVIIASSWQKVD